MASNEKNYLFCNKTHYLCLIKIALGTFYDKSHGYLTSLIIRVTGKIYYRNFLEVISSTIMRAHKSHLKQIQTRWREGRWSYKQQIKQRKLKGLSLTVSQQHLPPLDGTEAIVPVLQVEPARLTIEVYEPQSLEVLADQKITTEMNQR